MSWASHKIVSTEWWYSKYLQLERVMLQETYLIILANIQFFSSDVMDVTVMVTQFLWLPWYRRDVFKAKRLCHYFFLVICCRLSLADSLGINKYLRIQIWYFFDFYISCIFQWEDVIVLSQFVLASVFVSPLDSHNGPEKFPWEWLTQIFICYFLVKQECLHLDQTWCTPTDQSLSLFL